MEFSGSRGVLRVVTTCYNPRNAYGIGSGPSSEGFVPIISEMPGFVAYYWVDAGDGVMVSTSVFEHKDAEEQSNFRAGEFVAKNLAETAKLWWACRASNKSSCIGLLEELQSGGAAQVVREGCEDLYRLTRCFVRAPLDC